MYLRLAMGLFHIYAEVMKNTKVHPGLGRRHRLQLSTRGGPGAITS